MNGPDQGPLTYERDMTVSDIFKESTDQAAVPFADPNAVSLDDLVGEGKKYSSQEDLVKALAHSQNHIATLESTMGDLRKDLDSRLTVEDALKKLSSPQETTPKTETATPAKASEEIVQEETKDASITLADVEKLMSVKDQQANSEKNMAEVLSRLNTLTGGTDASAEFIQKKATELGMSVSALREHAEANPKVFFKLVDVSENSGVAPTGALQSYAAPNTPRAADPNRMETSADFDELRRQNPTRYFSPKVQRELMKVRMKELENRNP